MPYKHHRGRSWFIFETISETELGLALHDQEIKSQKFFRKVSKILLMLSVIPSKANSLSLFHRRFDELGVRLASPVNRL